MKVNIESRSGKQLVPGGLEISTEVSLGIAGKVVVLLVLRASNSSSMRYARSVLRVAQTWS